MYTVIKRMEISAAHSLRLSYSSKCENLHGHNWIITVYCRSKELNVRHQCTFFVFGIAKRTFQVASGKADENSGSAGIKAFPL